MTKDEQEKVIEAHLESAGFSGLGPIQPDHDIDDVEVWKGMLKSPSGDARFEIRVYDLARWPGLVVDFEEDKFGFENLSSRISSSSEALVLLHSVRTPELAFLLTCRKRDGHVFEDMVSEKASGTYSYHPQLDRIFGGDYFRQQEKVWTKACMMSLQRAKELYATLRELSKAYEECDTWPSKVEDAIPEPLAVFQLSTEPISSLKVPVEYGELALMVTVVTSPQTLAATPASDAVVRSQFIAQVFRGMRLTHRQQMAFSQGMGCNYLPQFLTPEGALTDAYFLWKVASVDDREEMWRCQETDLINGFLTAIHLAEGDIARQLKVLLECVSVYLEPEPLRLDLEELILDAGNDWEYHRVPHVKRIAASVLSMTTQM
jgi:hypothetical protein